jgi:hypothetical protein
LSSVTCEKKAAQSDGITLVEQNENAETEKVDKTPEEIEKTVQVVKDPYFDKKNVILDKFPDPISGEIPANPYRDIRHNLDDLESVLTFYNWDFGFENSFIVFKEDGKYSLGHKMHDGYGSVDFAFGNYEVSGNNVIVRYPHEIHDGGNETDFYIPSVLDWLFEGKEERLLVYDKTYRISSVVTCLRYGDKILRNYALWIPYGQKYEVDGFELIRCNDSTSMVEIKDNLKIRSQPDINAENVTLSVGDSPNITWTVNIVKAGEIYSYDQKTVKQDTIDGITAPWYKINIAISNYSVAGVWVFGGYLRELTPEEVKEWFRERGMPVPPQSSF